MTDQTIAAIIAFFDAWGGLILATSVTTAMLLTVCMLRIASRPVPRVHGKHSNLTVVRRIS